MRDRSTTDSRAPGQTLLALASTMGLMGGAMRMTTDPFAILLIQPGAADASSRDILNSLPLAMEYAMQAALRPLPVRGDKPSRTAVRILLIPGVTTGWKRGITSLWIQA